MWRHGLGELLRREDRGFGELLPEAQRLAAVRRSAPDVARHLPLQFDKALANPCFHDANHSGALRCLPAFLVAGGMQCGVSDLWSRLRKLALVRSEHDAAPHWWSNHPRSRAGEFDNYVGATMMATPRAVAALEREPASLLGDASPATFAFMFAEQLRMHYLWLDAFAACHSACRSRRPPERYAAQCGVRTYDLAHCYGAADAAAVPSAFNVPSLIRTVYGEARAPRVVVLLRDPAVRLWIAFHNYGQYPARYGAGDTGFGYYVGNQTAAWYVCAAKYGTRLCALRFEGYGAAEAEVYYHCDQIIKGMYAVFVPEWQAAIPAERLLFFRTEAYVAHPLRALRRVSRLLGLPPPSPGEARAAAGVRSADELEATERRHGSAPRRALEPVRRFYAPFNRALATQLADESFAWPASRVT